MPDELEGFEQCWLTGTAAEVTPVGQIGDYTFEVGALPKRYLKVMINWLDRESYF